MITITASILTTTDNRQEVVALCAEHSARSRAERGCISHHIYADCEELSRLFFHEQWHDEAAVSAHFQVPESLKFVQALSALVGMRPVINIHRSEKISPEAL
ncbi:MAG: putative quinol monooxygenase [Parasphingorhabdus sp.]